MDFPAAPHLQEQIQSQPNGTPCPELALMLWARQARLGTIETTSAERVLLKSLNSRAEVTPVLMTLDLSASHALLPAGVKTYSNLLGEHDLASGESLLARVTPHHSGLVGYVDSLENLPRSLPPGVVQIEPFGAEPLWRCLAWLDPAQKVAKARLLQSLHLSGCSAVTPRYYWPGYLEVLARAPHSDRPLESLTLHRVGVPARVLRALFKSWASEVPIDLRALLTHKALRTNYLQ